MPPIRLRAVLCILPVVALSMTACDHDRGMGGRGVGHGLRATQAPPCPQFTVKDTTFDVGPSGPPIVMLSPDTVNNKSALLFSGLTQSSRLHVHGPVLWGPSHQTAAGYTVDLVSGSDSFPESVELRIGYGQCGWSNNPSPYVIWRVTATDTTELNTGTYPSKQYVRVDLHHFSDYLIAD